MSNTYKFAHIGQGPAKLVTDSEKQLDDHGLTNPNLHRRIEKIDNPSNIEAHPEINELVVQDVYSYRTTIRCYHDEDSEYDEIP